MPNPEETQLDSHPRSRRVGHRGIVTLAVGVALGGILLLHGVTWWYAPIAVPLVAVGHVVLFGWVAALGGKLTRGRHGHDRPGGEPPDHVHAGSHEHGHDGHEGGEMGHSARVFDWLAALLTLGREQRLRRWTLELGAVRPASSVLDVGCGTGTLLLAAAELVGAAGEIHGVEPSSEMRRRAEGKAALQGVAITIVDGTAATLPYAAATFDAVFCTLALHHVPREDHDAALREMLRVLRPGGRVVIVEFAEPPSKVRALLDPMFIVWALHRSGRREDQLVVSTLHSKLKRIGFSEVTTHAYGSGALGAVVGRRERGDTGS